MKTEKQKEAEAKINALLAEADAKLAEAARIADEAGVDFYWSGPDYGMGGYYTPEGKADEWGGSTSGGWQASSYSC